MGDVSIAPHNRRFRVSKLPLESFQQSISSLSPTPTQVGIRISMEPIA